jgi:hypothetical protein
MISLWIAVIKDQRGLHVVNGSNSDGRCKGLQQAAARLRVLGGSKLPFD